MNTGRTALTSALFLCLGAGCGARLLTASAAETPLLERFEERLEAQRDVWIAMRRDLHRHPEVSGQEERTAGIVAERLRELGLDVRTGIGGHGVVAVLRGTEPGPVVAYRADMDAVPSSAPDPVDFRSRTPGVRHICGHDLHTTIGVAIADGLASLRDELAGTVVFVFQPAEERATGARAMLAEHALDDPRPEAILALHTAPLEVGQLATAAGGMMPGRDRVRVTLTGSADLDAAAEAVRTALRAVGNVAPQQAAAPAAPGFVLAQIGAPQGAGTTRTVTGLLTMAGDDTRRRTREAVAEALAALHFPDVAIEHTYEPKVIAGVTNDPALVEQVNASIRRVLGVGTVQELQSIVPAFSEDFGSFQDLVPGAFYFLGVSNAAKGWVGMPHSPGYVADEEALFVGARAMAAALLDLLVSG